MDSENSGCWTFQRLMVETDTSKKSANCASVAPSAHSFAACSANSGLYLVGRPPFAIHQG